MILKCLYTVKHLRREYLTERLNIPAAFLVKISNDLTYMEYDLVFGKRVAVEAFCGWETVGGRWGWGPDQLN